MDTMSRINQEVLAIAAIQEVIQAFNDGDQNLSDTLARIAVILERLGIVATATRKSA